MSSCGGVATFVPVRSRALDLSADDELPVTYEIYQVEFQRTILEKILFVDKKNSDLLTQLLLLSAYDIM